MIRVYVGERGKKVYIQGYLGFMGTGGVRTAYSEKDGYAYINFDDYGPSFEGEVYINGRRTYKGRIGINDSF